MHGTGNDFVVLNGFRRPVRMTAVLARRLCDRRFGVGADQILTLEKSKAADFRMRIFNADGSQVEMCGNGIRCLARYARERGLTSKREMTVETLGGIKRMVIHGAYVRVDMGEPILDAAKVPTRSRGRVIEKPFRFHSLPPLRGRVGVGGIMSCPVTCLSLGNPHAVFFVEDVDRVPLELRGRAIENHPFFPRRTNVEFVQVLDPGRARVRVWERGAGATPACGTGACAAAVAGVLTGRFRRRVALSMPGGDLGVEWAGDNHVFLSGPAAFVYDGDFYV